MKRKGFIVLIICILTLSTGCKSQLVKEKEEDVRVKNEQVELVVGGYEQNSGAAKQKEKAIREYMLKGEGLGGVAEGFLGPMRQEIELRLHEEQAGRKREIYDEEGELVGVVGEMTVEEQQRELEEALGSIEIKYYIMSTGVVEQNIRTMLRTGKTAMVSLYWEYGELIDGAYEIIE